MTVIVLTLALNCRNKNNKYEDDVTFINLFQYNLGSGLFLTYKYQMLVSDMRRLKNTNGSCVSYSLWRDFGNWNKCPLIGVVS